MTEKPVNTGVHVISLCDIKRKLKVKLSGHEPARTMC